MVVTTRCRSSSRTTAAAAKKKQEVEKPHRRRSRLASSFLGGGEDEAATKSCGRILPVDCPSPYESLRLQRIAENRVRMAALGVQKSAASLTAIFKATKVKTPTYKRSCTAKLDLQQRVIRRSERLKRIAPPGFDNSESNQVCYDETSITATRGRLGKKAYRNYQDMETIRPANAPLPKNCPTDLKVSPALLAYRCMSKDRGTLYDAIVGICCHFCRQKKLCGEENCERCGTRDVSKPCLGKTDCSRCHSSTGVFCRACLRIRYGEEIEEVKQNSSWVCPHCSEEQGLNPYWICNSSICLTRRKIAPTGIAIFKARESGFKSVAHYLADLLQRQGFHA